MFFFGGGGRLGREEGHSLNKNDSTILRTAIQFLEQKGLHRS